VPKTFNFLQDLDNSGVPTQLHSMELIMGLFGTMLPVEHMTHLMDNFIHYGWNFFYKLLIVFYKEIEPRILKLEDAFDVVELVKSYAYLNPNKEELDWSSLINKAKIIRL